MFHFSDVKQNLYELMRVHFPEMVMFQKLFFDPDLEFFYAVSIIPRRLSYLYQKSNIMGSNFQEQHFLYHKRSTPLRPVLRDYGGQVALRQVLENKP